MPVSVRSQCRHKSVLGDRFAFSLAAHRSSTSTSATFAPWRANCSTIDAPIPEAPPVIRTTRSRRLGYWAVRETSGMTRQYVTAKAWGELQQLLLAGREYIQILASGGVTAA